MEHYSFPDISTFVEKHNRYSSCEAAAWRTAHPGDEKSLRSTPFGTGLERKRRLKKATMRAPFGPSLRFLYHCVWKQGFRDRLPWLDALSSPRIVRAHDPAEGARTEEATAPRRSSVVGRLSQMASIRICCSHGPMAGHSRIDFCAAKDGPSGRGYSKCTLHPFYQYHVCPSGALAHLARLAIFFAVQPLFGALH